VLALIIAAIVFGIGKLLTISYLWVLLIQLLVGAAFVILFCEFVKFKDYMFVKELVVEKFRDFRKKKY
jgi:hypothetical protein